MSYNYTDCCKECGKQRYKKLFPPLFVAETREGECPFCKKDKDLILKTEWRII